MSIAPFFCLFGILLGVYVAAAFWLANKIWDRFGPGWATAFILIWCFGTIGGLFGLSLALGLQF